MRIVKSIAELRSACRSLRREGRRLGFVPTMGALHEGHMSLVRRARAECEVVVASIFVNPLQFAAEEDLDRYPRTFEEDCRQLQAEGVEYLFAPGTEEMYPDGTLTTVTVSGVGDRLDGASRPGHFTGVATVVAKLFNVVLPDRAYFGQKDAAQLAVLRQMVRDLNFDVELVGCAIVRDADGLALSSRNKYLGVNEREQALVLNQTLLQIQRMIAEGERHSGALVRYGLDVLHRAAGVRVDYLAIVDPNTLLPVTSVVTGTLVAAAAYVSKTRLIDNFLAP
jgi:pantoate--beta-alanine ligase